MTTATELRLPVGAAVLGGGGVHFRVWAPRCSRVEVVFEGREGTPADGDGQSHEMMREGGGYWSCVVGSAGPGTLYRYRLDGGKAYPDPASRFQPEGPHGPSEVIDPGAFAWSDAAWRGIPTDRHVLYELHVGTFTREGTW